MILDFSIVLFYFIIIMVFALRGRVSDQEATPEMYFLSNRSLRWPSIAISTIATNVQGYQFLGMMGSAYLYGLAQANLEVNAITGLVMSAFIFVPLYLKHKVITITQFIEKVLGEYTALFYSVANILLFSTVGLGSALFFGAYAAELIFADYFSFISDDPMVRVAVIAIALGIFSAIYSYLGGLNAVVKTDIIQFTILTAGGLVVLFMSIYHLGGWGQLYEKTPELMHMHLPADHPKLPWTLIFGLFLLNINYWCGNQSVVQRSLAARSLRHAQVGLLVGGLMKILMAAIIIIPGIALAGILGDNGLQDPDQTFPYLVQNYLPVGLRGLIICALFASLMSTIDSTFNSLSTLFSIDIYQKYINPTATDLEIVKVGRNTILVTLLTGASMAIYLIYEKLGNPEQAFTHYLNELRYYINCGIVLLLCTVAFIKLPNRVITLILFLCSAIVYASLKYVFPDMNYFVRAGWVISVLFLLNASATGLLNRQLPFKIEWKISHWNVMIFAIVEISLMVLIHLLFH